MEFTKGCFYGQSLGCPYGHSFGLEQALRPISLRFGIYPGELSGSWYGPLTFPLVAR